MDMNESKPDQRPTLLRRIFSPENLIALAVCLILIALVIATADSAPQWIYQGF